MDILNIKDLSYYYPGTEQPVLKDICLSIKKGEFVLLMGSSGCGKSTLARVMCRLIPDFYGGKISGDIFYRGKLLRDWHSKKLYSRINMVFQEPEAQTVFQSPERDIAFGLENLGMEAPMMKRRIAEIKDYMNLQNLTTKLVSQLSGGEKQKIALAGVVAMNPEIIILDEPTSRLDPVSAGEFINLLKKLNDETGMTIILIEHKLDQCFHLADRVIVMEEGRVVYQGTPSAQVEWALHKNYPLVPLIPSLFAGRVLGSLPLTVKEGRDILGKLLPGSGQTETIEPKIYASSLKSEPVIIDAQKISYAYHSGKPAVKNVEFKIHPGEIVALLGSNGAGKSTLLRLVMGLLPVQRGKLRIGKWAGKEIKPEVVNNLIGYLPQEIQDFFLADTVLEDVTLNVESDNGQADYWMSRLGISRYRDNDPRLLSAGEKKLVALTALLTVGPEMLLLDEPTTGMDGEQKRVLGEIITEICRQHNQSVLMVTHDMDFVCDYAGRVLFMHEGELLADGTVDEITEENIFYTSGVMKLFRGFKTSVINKKQALAEFNNIELINREKDL